MLLDEAVLIVTDMILVDNLAKEMSVVPHARQREGHTERSNGTRSRAYEEWLHAQAHSHGMVAKGSICIGLGWMIRRIVLYAVRIKSLPKDHNFGYLQRITLRSRETLLRYSQPGRSGPCAARF